MEVTSGHSSLTCRRLPFQTPRKQAPGVSLCPLAIRSGLQGVAEPPCTPSWWVKGIFCFPFIFVFGSCQQQWGLRVCLRLRLLTQRRWLYSRDLPVPADAPRVWRSRPLRGCSFIASRAPALNVSASPGRPQWWSRSHASWVHAEIPPELENLFNCGRCEL